MLDQALKSRASVVLLAVFLATTAVASEAPAPSGWQLGPFVRPQQGNPVITPLTESLFTDPMSKAPVHWEALHTFNPAAIVRAAKS